MGLRGRCLAALPLLGVVCALAAFLGGARADTSGPSRVVEVERWLRSADGSFRRVTIVVDTRLVDPDAVVEARYPGALDVAGVTAQFATFARWDLADVPVPVAYNDAHDPPGIAGRPQLLAAMASWNGVAGQDFRFADGGATAAATPDCTENNGDGGNTVQFSVALPNGVLGETCTFFADDAFPDLDRIIEFDIHLDKASTDWSVAPQTPNNRFDVLSVMLHELGHALGLDHAADGTVMQLFLDAGQQFRIPTSDDIAGMRALYGSPATQTPSPTSTPSPTPSPTPTPTPAPDPSPVPGYPYRVSLGSLARD